MRKAKRGEAQEFIHNLPDTPHCVLWPFSLYASGYGYVNHEGALRPAHRVALMLATGMDCHDLDASHTCHIRQCVNPRHVKWKTRSENLLDRPFNGTINRGENNGRAKLTREDVKHIQRDTRVQHVIAKEYGVAQATVSKIKRGLRWVA